MFRGIDFFSDTLTQPTRAMKEAMMAAELGDEQQGEDPTTLALEARMAEILGTTAAMFFPSSTMSNQVAIRLHTSPGDELLADENCHLFFAEAGGPAVHSGVMARPIRSQDGTFTGDDVRQTFRRAIGPHFPVSRLVNVENTTNMGGGVAWPLEKLKSVIEASRELGLKTHLDGSRLFNASVKTGRSPRELCAGFDTITICFSKGLGCATGAVLGYPAEKFREVRRFKQLMGGAMRQSGILSAACLYALEHHVERLHEDHANAKLLAERLAKVPGVRVETTDPSTNMVFFHWENPRLTPSAFSDRCETRGVRFSQVGPSRFRAVTHLGVSRDAVEKASEILLGIEQNK